MKYYRWERKIKCPNRKLGTHSGIHLLSVEVTKDKYGENVLGIKDHQALEQATYQSLEFGG